MIFLASYLWSHDELILYLYSYICMWNFASVISPTKVIIPKTIAPFLADFRWSPGICEWAFKSFLGSPWGIYPDLLHIADLQLSHDVISSCLIEMSESRRGPRDQQLQPLWNSYEKWCTSQRSMAKKLRKWWTFFLWFKQLMQSKWWSLDPTLKSVLFFFWGGWRLCCPSGSCLFEKAVVQDERIWAHEESHFILELLGSYSLQKLWWLGGLHIVPCPKRSWRGQQLACSSLGCVVCCLHPTMAPFTTSTSTRKHVFHAWKKFPPVLKNQHLIRSYAALTWTIWGIGSRYAFHWLLSTQSALNMGRLGHW